MIIDNLKKIPIIITMNAKRYKQVISIFVILLLIFITQNHIINAKPASIPKQDTTTQSIIEKEPNSTSDMKIDDTENQIRQKLIQQLKENENKIDKVETTMDINTNAVLDSKSSNSKDNENIIASVIDLSKPSLNIDEQKLDNAIKQAEKEGKTTTIETNNSIVKTAIIDDEKSIVKTTNEKTNENIKQNNNSNDNNIKNIENKTIDTKKTTITNNDNQKVGETKTNKIEENTLENKKSKDDTKEIEQETGFFSNLFKADDKNANKDDNKTQNDNKTSNKQSCSNGENICINAMNGIVIQNTEQIKDPMNIKINDGTKDIYINIMTSGNSDKNKKKHISKKKQKSKKTVSNKDKYVGDIKNTTAKTFNIKDKQPEVNNNSRNIYILNTIISIDEDDVITEDTLEKVQIDQGSLVQLMNMPDVSKKTAEVIGNPIVENKKEPNYKDNYIASAIYKDRDVNNYRLKYGEVAFVDSYIGD